MFRLDTLSTVSSQGEARVEISEEMIEFVKMNPRVMRRWQSLAHSAGLSHRVEVTSDHVANVRRMIMMIITGDQGPDTQRGPGHGRACRGVHQRVDGVQAGDSIPRRFNDQGQEH